MFNWIAQEDVLALQREEAVLAGKNARFMLELEDLEAAAEAERESMRHRLARTLVALGMRIDPLAARELDKVS